MAEELGIQLREPPFTDDSPPPIRRVSRTRRGYQLLPQEEDDQPLHPQPLTSPPVPGTSGAALAGRGFQHLTYGQEEDQYPSTPPVVTSRPPRSSYSSAAPPQPQRPAITSTQQPSVVSTVQPRASTGPRHVVVGVSPLAKEHMILTVILIAICCAINPTTLFCLCPAFIFSSLAIDQNNQGRYRNAKHYGMAAMICNTVAIVYLLLLLVLGGIAGALIAILIVY